MLIYRTDTPLKISGSFLAKPQKCILDEFYNRNKKRYERMTNSKGYRSTKSCERRERRKNN